MKEPVGVVCLDFFLDPLHINAIHQYHDPYSNVTTVTCDAESDPGLPLTPHFTYPQRMIHLAAEDSNGGLRITWDSMRPEDWLALPYTVRCSAGEYRFII